MAGVTVSLPDDQHALFPPRCIACGADRCDEITEVEEPFRLHRQLCGCHVSVRVPICTTCERDLRDHRAIGGFVQFLILMISVGIGVTLLEAMHIPANAWVRRIVESLLVGGIMYAFRQGYGASFGRFLPPPTWDAETPFLRLKSTGDTIQCEFRDEDYAREFGALNQRESDS